MNLRDVIEKAERALDLHRQLNSRPLTGGHATLDPWTVDQACRETLTAIKDTEPIEIDGEGTRDPIFALQRKQIRVTEPPDGWEWSDGEDGGFVWDEWTGNVTPETDPDVDFEEDCKPFLSYKAAHARGGENCIEWWETERIFLTREEGTAWVQRQEYNYSGGWRIYCMCAEGQLTKVLSDVRQTK